MQMQKNSKLGNSARLSAQIERIHLCRARVEKRNGKEIERTRPDYLAAQMVISTSVPGVSAAPTAVRVGRFERSTQAIHASFIASLRLASAI